MTTIIISSGCNKQNKPLDIDITSGDIISGTDTISIDWPTTEHKRTWVVCTESGDCTSKIINVTGYFKTYDSKELWIKFSVYAYGNQMETAYDNHFNSIIRSGDSVHIINSTIPNDQGQWIEAFDKLSTETVKQSIQRQFLSGQDTNCFVSILTGNPSTVPQQFIIDHPASKDMKKRCKDDGLCYADRFCGTYAIGGSVHFFMGNDTGTKIYFIEWGQDNIPWRDGNPRYVNMLLQ